MDDPPDDVIAAVMRLDERREKTAELSALCEDDHTQHECAAGALCAAPPGTDVSASAHRCLDCRGKIHCAMWCGENWGEYIESDRCKITPDQLSAAGRASVQGSDHELITICRVCIDRELQNQRDRRRTLTTELANHIGSAGARQDAKERIAAYRLLKRSDDSDGDNDNPYVDSQESLIVSIVDFETFISNYESQHRDQKKLLKSSLRDLSNEK